jgi:hypothetical protein
MELAAAACIKRHTALDLLPLLLPLLPLLPPPATPNWCVVCAPASSSSNTQYTLSPSSRIAKESLPPAWVVSCRGHHGQLTGVVAFRMWQLNSRHELDLEGKQHLAKSAAANPLQVNWSFSNSHCYSQPSLLSTVVHTDQDV